MARSPRKQWESLSPDYRRRLERFGVTRETHATAPLYQARGHFPRDESAGREKATKPGTRFEGGRKSYREASREWERVRHQLRGLPTPLRAQLRQGILIDRKFTEDLDNDVVRVYRNAQDAFASNPEHGKRGDIVDALQSDLFELEYQYAYLDFDWIDELDIWYH